LSRLSLKYAKNSKAKYFQALHKNYFEKTGLLLSYSSKTLKLKQRQSVSFKMPKKQNH